MKNIPYYRLIFIMLISLFSCTSHASCYAYGSTHTTYITIGNVMLQRDTPVGTVLKSASGTGNGGDYDKCDNGGYEYKAITYSGSNATAYSHVYTTNIPGIGISVRGGSSTYYEKPARSTYISGSTIGVATGTMTVEVVVIGTPSSGTLTNGEVARLSTEEGSGRIFTVLTGSNTVTVATCSITTPNLVFPIGDVPSSNFGSSVGTIPSGAQNTQNLGLNCNSQANINVSLSGTQNPDVGNNSVLALTGQGSPGVATGVGVQIVYNGSPLILNNRIVMKHSSGGQETFPLTARYYQTRSSVTTGTANTSATLNLTYQ